MKKIKKICISFGHLQNSNGVSRVAIATANILSKEYDVTLVPLFTFEKEALKMVNNNVHVRRVFGFYFHGFVRLVDLIPDFILYWLIFGRFHYDLEIAYQKDMPIKIIGGKHCHYDTKKIAWMHGYDEGLTLKEQYERIGKVVCVSKCNSERLSKELPSIKSDYCYNPIDDVKIVEQGKEPIDIQRPEGKILFVSVGRMSPEKGYYRLLDICARLKNEGYDFSLWLIGNGPENERLIKHRAELKLEDVVTLIGATPNPHKYTSKADVFICSSFSEGYSTACTEAIMLGVPVITTNVSGGREIIEDSQAGILCDLEDNALYDAMKEVLTDSSQIEEWKNTIAESKHVFSKQYRLKKLFEIVSNTLNNYNK